MAAINLALHAMATRFELVLHGENPVRLRAAGEEALGEIERLEAQLSLYRATSEIAHLNTRAVRAPVRVTPSLFALLRQAKELHRESSGAFDITIAPLVQCWGFMAGSGHMPEPAAVAAARAAVGMDLVQLDPENFTVRFAREGVMLDLGAIGKGYAIERAVEILRDAGVTSALLHGGTSTVYALGHPPEADSWKIAVQSPRSKLGTRPESAPDKSSVDARPTGQERLEPLLATVPLRDQAMSVSAVWGRCFQAQGKTFGHILDPRTGHPATGAVLAAVVLPSATETDALSTALLVLNSAGPEVISRTRPDAKTLVVLETETGFDVRADQIEVAPEFAR